MKTRLILASASPRRAEILRDAGFSFEVTAAQVDETRVPRETAAGYVERLASNKARLVAQLVKEGREKVFVIGADTVVVSGRHILGKPNSVADARRMLRLLSGGIHEVVTGVSVVSSPGRREQLHVEKTEVQFLRLSEWDIKQYLATGEPFDKAGAYGIQGIGGRFVSRIRGCYFNVMGLPLSRVWYMLLASGWREPGRRVDS